MSLMVVNQTDVPDEVRRSRVFAGEVFSVQQHAAVTEMADFAWQLIVEAFAGRDPSTAHEELPVEEYVKILGPLKTGFTHHPHSKTLMRDVLVALGCDDATTYFDVPKLRTVTPASYLTAGLGYNYLPHRDTWYSAPHCQLNWWAPIRNVSSESCMAFHPDFWRREAPNSSDAFDAYEWNRTARRDAATYIDSDPRPHPHLTDTGPGTDVRIVGGSGSIICFSGAQLHSTVPNTGTLARFSLDFRTINIDDVASGAGAPNIDARCTGTTLRDFLRLDTHERLPDALIAEYDVGGSSGDGVLVFDPAVLAEG